MCNFLDFSNDPVLWKKSAERIVERRNALGLSQKRFIEELNKYVPCKRSTVSRWENAVCPINKLEHLGAVCRILECDPEYITCQCDTLRKQFADPVSRFGLSEQSFTVLEQDPGRKDAAAVVDFVLCRGNVRQAFRSLLDLQNRIQSEKRFLQKKFPADYEQSQQHKNDSPGRLALVNGELTAVPIEKLDIYGDEFGQYIVDPEQAGYIAEQQLIAEIREALKE